MTLTAAALRASIDGVAWSLLHFLWQGALIAGVLELGLLAMRRRSAQARYLVCCLALAAMALAPPATFVLLRAGDAHGAGAGWGAVAAGGEPSFWHRILDGSLSTWVVGLWSLGAAVLSVRLLLGYLRVRRLHLAARGGALPPRWQRCFDRLAGSIGVRAVARVVDATVVAAPTVIGWLRPVVLVPARVLTGLPEDQIEALIAHELAHVRRHDFVVNLLQCLLEALLFYHPAVWWVSSGIRREREYCCDDVALRVTEDGVSFARALTSLEAWRGEELQVGVSTLGGSLMHRIERLVGIDSTGRRHVRGAWRALMALFVAGSLGATALGLAAQDREGACARCLSLAQELRVHAGTHGQVADQHGRRERHVDPRLEGELRDVNEALRRVRESLKGLEGARSGKRGLSEAEKLHEHLRGALERNLPHLELGELADAKKLHEHLQGALERDLSHFELGELADAKKLHEHLQGALERDLSQPELGELFDAKKLHEHLREALPAQEHLRQVLEHSQPHLELLKLPDAKKLHEHLREVPELDLRLELLKLPEIEKVRDLRKALELDLPKLEQLQETEKLHEHLLEALELDETRVKLHALPNLDLLRETPDGHRTPHLDVTELPRLRLPAQQHLREILELAPRHEVPDAAELHRKLLDELLRQHVAPDGSEHGAEHEHEGQQHQGEKPQPKPARSRRIVI